MDSSGPWKASVLTRMHHASGAIVLIPARQLHKLQSWDHLASKLPSDTVLMVVTNNNTPLAGKVRKASQGFVANGRRVGTMKFEEGMSGD